MVFLPRDYPSEYHQDMAAQTAQPYPNNFYDVLGQSLPEPGVFSVPAPASHPLRGGGHVAVPSNGLAGTISGAPGRHSDWRDAVDASVTATFTPAAANGSTTAAVTFSNWSAAAIALLRAPQQGRLLLCVRAALIASTLSNLSAPGTPPVTTTNAAGGTIAAGTYQTAYSWVTPAGETPISAVQAITTTGATSTVTITVPALPPGATGWNAYMSQLGGTTLTKQGATQGGLADTITAPPTTTGNQPPTANSAAPAGAVFLSLQTSGGDMLPIGAASTSGIASLVPDVVGPAGIASDYLAPHLLIVQSVGVSGAVSMSVLLAVSLVAVRSR